ncbi:DUF418 domain-containing protein [Pseudoalteromonas haloplanktis]|uniref:DUF418 domain-containing protein n=1 Tax=Pseudoalteromonas haloplanktis TaxID=228 RepID=A0ABU1BBA4_PSEHA|nr:DUF418 domain-containing protein [Pseudoalteromonas haloplanktis]MDQ9091804.1 DUF418 domain-containing protein [Pseudoalteromonas haloplanktis]
MRNNNMDVIRGIAVLGLMYMNVYTFGLFEYGYVPAQFPPFSDHLLQIANLIFIDGRFRTLFCLLFGAALYIQWQHYQDIVVLKKRLKVLAYIGLLHGFFLWAGDILFIYACSGWLVCKYLNHDDAFILKRGGQFLVIGSCVSFLLLLVEPNHIVTRADNEFIQTYQDTYSSWLAIMSTNALVFFIMLIVVPLITLWMSAGLMLIGIYAYKNAVFKSGLPKQYVKYVCIAALVFTGFRIVLEYLHSPLSYALKEPINWLAALFVALLVIHLVVKEYSQGCLFYSGFQRLGRLSLSVYITQTLILFTLFKVLYPDWTLTFNRIDYFLLVTFIAILQFVVCQFYSHFFKRGPLEVVWRKLSS